MTAAAEFDVPFENMNSYLSLVSIRVPEKIRREASRNYLRSGGSNLLQNWPLAGLPSLAQIPASRIRSSRRQVRK